MIVGRADDLVERRRAMAVARGIEHRRKIIRRDRVIPTKPQPVERPLFPRYGFIAFDHRDSSWSPIRNTPGVVDLVRCGTLPAYTNAAAVVRLQAVAALGRTHPTGPGAGWRVGAAVAPACGPFRGMAGVVMGMDADEATATVGIMFLGQLREVSYPVEALVAREDW